MKKKYLLIAFLLSACSSNYMLTKPVDFQSNVKYRGKYFVASVDNVEVIIYDSARAHIAIERAFKGLRWEYKAELFPFFGKKNRWSDTNTFQLGWRNDTATVFGCDKGLCVTYLWNEAVVLEKLKRVEAGNE